jgi:hypothetical protein
MSSTVRQGGSDGSASWCEILFDSGERVFISIEVWPTAAIKVTRLVLGGLIPVKTVWKLTPAKVGGYYGYVSCFNRMFSVNKIKRRGPLEAIRDVLLQCSSIEQAHRTLSELETSSMTDRNGKAS